MTQWVDEWLAEIEQKEVQDQFRLSSLQADQCLQKIAELEAKLNDVESLATEEQLLIERYRQTESDRIMKKVSYLSAQLEFFMRDHNAKTNDKSLALVHGQLKLRQQRDKLEIENIEQLMPVASAKGLLRVVPEAFEIDLPKLNKYVKASGDVPPGVKVISGDTKFSYITIKGGNHVEQRESAQVGIESGAESAGDALEAAAHR